MRYTASGIDLVTKNWVYIDEEGLARTLFIKKGVGYNDIVTGANWDTDDEAGQLTILLESGNFNIEVKDTDIHITNKSDPSKSFKFAQNTTQYQIDQPTGFHPYNLGINETVLTELKRP